MTGRRCERAYQKALETISWVLPEPRPRGAGSTRPLPIADFSYTLQAWRSSRINESVQRTVSGLSAPASSRRRGSPGRRQLRRERGPARTAGSGHLSQGRFQSFPVPSDEHCLTVCRYVERKGLRANLVGVSQRFLEPFPVGGSQSTVPETFSGPSRATPGYNTGGPPHWE